MLLKKSKILAIRKILNWVLATLLFSSCTGQVKDKSANDSIADTLNKKPINRSTTFPQIHTNLNGMVSEFVRSMYQDKKGNYWFGTNGNGTIQYNGQTLETVSIDGVSQSIRVLEIIEDKAGNVWFGTSDGLIKYDGKEFTNFSKKEGLSGYDAEIWGLTIDKSGLIWVGSIGELAILTENSFCLFHYQSQGSKIRSPCYLINWFLK